MSAADSGLWPRSAGLVLSLLLLLAPLGHGAAHASAAPALWELSLDGNYAYLVSESLGDPSGGGVALSLSASFSDSVSLRIRTAFTIHSVVGAEKSESGSLLMATTFLSICYALDTFPITPRIEAGTGLLYRDGVENGVDWGLKLALSLDYALTRRLILGVAMRYYSFITDPGRLPVYVEMGPRVALRW